MKTGTFCVKHIITILRCAALDSRQNLIWLVHTGREDSVIRHTLS